MRLQASKLKRAVALVAASCTLGTCCIAGSIAWAGGELASNTPTQGENTANIKSGQATSITIYKYEGPEGSVRNNGKEQKIPDAQKPISGVKFKITPIVGTNGNKIDLSKTTGWTAIKDLNVENKTAAKALQDAGLKASEAKADVVEQETGTDGSTTFNLGATYGLYLVEEDLANSAPKKDGKPIKVTKQVNPFLVTVPLPDTQTHTWIYNLKIYPKNDVSTSKVEKKAQTAPNKPFIDGTTTTMGWDISIPLTAIKDGGKTYTNVSFTDPINTDFLNYSSVKNVKVTDKDGNASDTLETTDYEVEGYSSIGNNPDKVNLARSENLKNVKWIRVKLTTTGLTKASAKVGGKLTATVVTTVIAPGNIKNYINTDVDGVATGEGGKTPGCIPTKQKPCDEDPNHPHEGGDTTNFAKLTIDKVGLSDNDNKDNGKPLQGAIFNVYEAAPGKTVDDLKGKTVDAAGSDLVKTGGHVRTMTATDDKGKASDSFFVGNGANVSHVYCAVETKAPDGFELDNKLHCVNLTAGADNSANTLKINNKKSTSLDKILGNLPMTGARGLVILTVCGIVGIAGTLFYIVMKRRKEQEQE
ncbi:SpaH/EbpB family LPXTG-anchored major pilin [Gardnerella swidsinskii]|uniref:SpaH/EbpB family LPXTG-anchored major pilin n=1 Tax=Gardnerella swidsinskii TaxID=2792979 RepID=UPI00200EA4C9|nr:SpaH/EbpB family LPXTG-anchored major pilin [Gardnerella swidsinskii]UQA88985.1 SpaH/EbpB family LPXTG-anchored major pilin [Gardnerella swidsinskii]